MRSVSASNTLRLNTPSRTLKNYLAVLFGSSAARVFALMSNILIARYLGGEGFGQFSLFYIVMLFAWIIPQALDTTFVKFAKDHKTADNIQRYWRVNVQFKLMYCIAMILLAWPASKILAEVFFHKPETYWLIGFGIAGGAMLSIMNSVASSLQVQEKFGRFAVLQGLYTIATFLGVWLLFEVFDHFDVAFVVGIYLFVASVVGIISLSVLMQNTPDLLLIERNISIQVVRFGKWIFLIAVALYTFPRIDSVILARYLDLDKLGIYSVATQLVMAISVITGSMGPVFLPKSMEAIKSTAALNSYLKGAFQPILLIIVAIFILELFAPVLIKTAYGESYSTAILPLRILLIGYLFSAVYLPFSYLYYALEVPYIRLFFEIAKVLFVLFLFHKCIPRWGLAGAAASMSVAMVFNCLVAVGVLVFWLRGLKEKH